MVLSKEEHIKMSVYPYEEVRVCILGGEFCTLLFKMSVYTYEEVRVCIPRRRFLHTPL